MRAVLSVGSNLGDRLGTLQGCVQAIGRLPDTDVLAISPVYQTAPVGGAAPARLPERGAHRGDRLAAAGPARPRPTASRRPSGGSGPSGSARGRLDIDIISYGGEVSADPELTLPHPRAHERAFVLQPWHDIEPGAELPGRGAVDAAAGRPGPRRRPAGAGRRPAAARSGSAARVP